MDWLLISQARLHVPEPLPPNVHSLTAQQPSPTRLQIYVSADFLPPAGVTTLRELNGQLTKIVARGSGGSSNIQILPTPPRPPGVVSHVRVMNVDATKI